MIDKKPVDESTTDSYNPPKYAIKPYPDDTGFALVKKNYKRLIWTWNEYNKENPFDHKVSEYVIEEPYLGEVPGMGSSNSSITSKATGYSSSTGLNQPMVPTDSFEDPDEKEKKKREQLKHVKKFKQFDPNPVIQDEDKPKKK